MYGMPNVRIMYDIYSYVVMFIYAWTFWMVFSFSLISHHLYRATQHPHVRTPPHIKRCMFFPRCCIHVNSITQCQISVVHPATRPTHFVALYVISRGCSFGLLDNDMVSPQPCPKWGTHGMKVVLNTIERNANDAGSIVGWADGWIRGTIFESVFFIMSRTSKMWLFWNGWCIMDRAIPKWTCYYMLGVLSGCSYINNCLLKSWCHMMACRWRT